MFIDTNVFVNSRIPSAPGHDVARRRLTRALQTDEPLRISRQISDGTATESYWWGTNSFLSGVRALDDDILILSSQIYQEGV